MVDGSIVSLYTVYMSKFQIQRALREILAIEDRAERKTAAISFCRIALAQDPGFPVERFMNDCGFKKRV
jgi:hypothetical protein